MAGARVAGQMRVSQPDLITENKVLWYISIKARRRSAKMWGIDDPAGREISNIFSRNLPVKGDFLCAHEALD